MNAFLLSGGRFVLGAFGIIAKFQAWLLLKVCPKIPGWPIVEGACVKLTAPVRWLSDKACAMVPPIRKHEWLFEAQSLKKHHPVMLTFLLSMVLWRGLRTTDLGHIGEDYLIYPLIGAISYFNPFLGLTAVIGFASGDFVQKLFASDMFAAEHGSPDFVGGLMGYCVAYWGMLIAGLLPGMLSRVFSMIVRKTMTKMFAKKAGATADGAVPPPGGFQSPVSSEMWSQGLGTYELSNEWKATMDHCSQTPEQFADFLHSNGIPPEGLGAHLTSNGAPPNGWESFCAQQQMPFEPWMAQPGGQPPHGFQNWLLEKQLPVGPPMPDAVPWLQQHAQPVPLSPRADTIGRVMRYKRDGLRSRQDRRDRERMEWDRRHHQGGGPQMPPMPGDPGWGGGFTGNVIPSPMGPAPDPRFLLPELLASMFGAGLGGYMIMEHIAPITEKPAFMWFREKPDTGCYRDEVNTYLRPYSVSNGGVGTALLGPAVSGLFPKEGGGPIPPGGGGGGGGPPPEGGPSPEETAERNSRIADKKQELDWHERNLRKLREEASRAHPSQRAGFESRILGAEANASAARDQLRGLETGQFKETRTNWQDASAQRERQQAADFAGKHEARQKDHRDYREFLGKWQKSLDKMPGDRAYDYDRIAGSIMSKTGSDPKLRLEKMRKINRIRIGEQIGEAIAESGAADEQAANAEYYMKTAEHLKTATDTVATVASAAVPGAFVYTIGYDLTAGTTGVYMEHGSKAAMKHVLTTGIMAGAFKLAGKNAKFLSMGMMTHGTVSAYNRDGAKGAMKYLGTHYVLHKFRGGKYGQKVQNYFKNSGPSGFRWKTKPATGGTRAKVPITKAKPTLEQKLRHDVNRGKTDVLKNLDKQVAGSRGSAQREVNKLVDLKNQYMNAKRNKLPTSQIERQLETQSVKLNSSYQGKNILKHQTDAVTQKLFARNINKLDSHVDNQMQRNLTQQGYTKAQVREFRNKASAGRPGIDHDVGLKEPNLTQMSKTVTKVTNPDGTSSYKLQPKYSGPSDPKFVKDTQRFQDSMKKWEGSSRTDPDRGYKKVKMRDYVDKAEQARNQAYKQVTENITGKPQDPHKAMQEFTYSGKKDAYKDMKVLQGYQKDKPFTRGWSEQTGSVTKTKVHDNFAQSGTGPGKNGLNTGEALQESNRGAGKDAASKWLPQLEKRQGLPPAKLQEARTLTQVAQQTGDRSMTFEKGEQIVRKATQGRLGVMDLGEYIGDQISGATKFH